MVHVHRRESGRFIKKKNEPFSPHHFSYITLFACFIHHFLRRERSVIENRRREDIQATLHTPNNTQNDAEVVVSSIVKSFFFSFYYHIHIHPKMDSPVFPLTLAFIVITYLIKVISERITFFFKSNVKYLVLDFLGKIILIAKIFETKRECNNFC